MLCPRKESILTRYTACDPVWPSGKALAVRRTSGSIPLRLYFSSIFGFEHRLIAPLPSPHNETLTHTSLPISVQNQSGGDSVAPEFPSSGATTAWDLSPRQYLSGNNSAFVKSHNSNHVVKSHNSNHVAYTHAVHT